LTVGLHPDLLGMRSPDPIATKGGYLLGPIYNAREGSGRGLLLRGRKGGERRRKGRGKGITPREKKVSVSRMNTGLDYEIIIVIIIIRIILLAVRTRPKLDNVKTMSD